VGTINVEQIPLLSQPTLVSGFGITYARDRRDNPADATRGTFNTIDLSDAIQSIGSSASFLRFYYQNSTYYPIKRGFSFARSTRIGILEPYRDTASLSFPEPNTIPLPTLIPLPERFFAGGGTSLRGFALNQAGPRDPVTGFPVGGQALLVFNQEFRFPMHLPYIGTALSGALFYDGGNVYSRLDHVTFRAYSPAPVFNPANPTQCQYNCTNELNYFAHTVGLGFRYSTPVGPIRVDLAYSINPPHYVGFSGTPAQILNCNPNKPPDQLPSYCASTPQSISHFQFFFSIGQTF